MRSSFSQQVQAIIHAKYTQDLPSDLVFAPLVITPEMLCNFVKKTERLILKCLAVTEDNQIFLKMMKRIDFCVNVGSTLSFFPISLFTIWPDNPIDIAEFTQWALKASRALQETTFDNDKHLQRNLHAYALQCQRFLQLCLFEWHHSHPEMLAENFTIWQTEEAKGFSFQTHYLPTTHE